MIQQLNSGRSLNSQMRVIAFIKYPDLYASGVTPGRDFLLTTIHIRSDKQSVYNNSENLHIYSDFQNFVSVEANKRLRIQIMNYYFCSYINRKSEQTPP
jgi:hypothetical protein